MTDPQRVTWWSVLLALTVAALILIGAAYLMRAVT